MDAWVTGIRREQSTTRHNARKIEVDERRGVVKGWAARRASAHIAAVCSVEMDLEAQVGAVRED